MSTDFPVQLATSRTRTTILADLSTDCLTRALFLARILARMSVRDARVYTCKRVLYTKLHDRSFANVGVGVRVGVGPEELQLH